MKKRIEYLPIGPEYSHDALDLVLAGYRRERDAVPCLPGGGFRQGLGVSLHRLLTEGSGVVAVGDEGLMGFLAGFPVGGLFGSANGVYCPLHGHGARGGDRPGMYREMYRIAAEAWVGNELTSHVVTAFAHDRELLDALYWLGFGLRCVDAIRPAEGLSVTALDGITVRKAGPEDAEALAGIHTRHHMYYRQSPMFMPRAGEDPIKEHLDWLSHKDRHEWVAYRDGVPVGIMSLGPTAETFVSNHPSVMNIKGAYVDDGLRGSGVATALLNTVLEWVGANGYRLCGVDFESINTLGSGFWMRHFTPYTHSVARRIDERILL